MDETFKNLCQNYLGPPYDFFLEILKISCEWAMGEPSLEFLLDMYDNVITPCDTKKYFPDSGKAYVLKRKVAKMRFRLSLQYTGLPWIREAFFRFEHVKFGFP